MQEQTILDLAVVLRMNLARTGAGGRPGHAACPLVRALNLPDGGVEIVQTRCDDNGLELLAIDSPEAAEATLRAHLAAEGPVDVLAVHEERLLVAANNPRELARRCAVLTDVDECDAPQSAAEQVDCRMQGCIAIVTGAAQGFGRGIADGLAARGAAVVIADLNEKLGCGAADELNATFGAGTAAFVPMNISNFESVRDGVAACIRLYGGVDMFVANAGVLKAGSLEDLEEKDFDLVTAVNYKGYYVCVRAVTTWMKRQHAVNPDHFMDIVQINSKSGLEGSRNNFAYAGSKFGTIGLTQSFALELVPWNIKVNAICPGNYFDGPLWSDPEHGLFVQYLRAGKVPGAASIEDVKAFYTDKVPMRRGCTPDDVSKAIAYLHEQTYETGQAIPVTGGQVMLN